MQTELQVLQTSLIETKCQILQALAGAMDRPASNQLEVMRHESIHILPSKANTTLLMFLNCMMISFRLLGMQRSVSKTLSRKLQS